MLARERVRLLPAERLGEGSVTGSREGRGVRRSERVVVGVLSAVFILAACTSGSGGAPPGAAATGLPTDQLQAALDATMEANDVPGAAAGVWTSEDSWVATVGEADLATGAPMEPGDIFPIRSVTKSMVVTLILQLAGRGKLSLGDLVGKFVVGVPNGNRITVRQLANMTSGLADYSKSPELGEALGEDLDRRWTDEELLAPVLKQPSNFRPGARFEYSNTNTILLGMIVEEVTGRSLGEELRARIFEPLGMEHTSYPADGVVPEPHPVGYQLDEEGTPQPVSVNMTALGPAGGVASTADDLHLWGQALADGRLITPELQRERLAGANAPGPDDPEYDGYAMGIGEIDGWWGHTGEGLGFEALVMSDPETNSTIVILMNLTGPEQHVPTELFREFTDILADGS